MAGTHHGDDAGCSNGSAERDLSNPPDAYAAIDDHDRYDDSTDARPGRHLTWRPHTRECCSDPRTVQTLDNERRRVRLRMWSRCLALWANQYVVFLRVATMRVRRSDDPKGDQRCGPIGRSAGGDPCACSSRVVVLMRGA